MFFCKRLGIALAVLFAALSSQSVWAFSPKVSIDPADPGTVIINGGSAVRFRATNGNLGIADRAQITAGRIQQLVGASVSPSTIFVKGDRHRAQICSGEQLICIVTATDAKASGTDALALANMWANNMKKLLAMPAVILSDRELTVPLGESRKVNVSGAAVGPIYAKAGDGDIASADSGADGRYVQVFGKKLGATSVEVSVEGERATINVYVKKYAGAVPSVTVAEVTGEPCPVELVTDAAIQALSQSATPEPGAKFDIENIRPAGGDLSCGSIRTLKIPVKFRGDGYIDCNPTATVEVRNVSMKPVEVSQLLYSNNPERLLKYQTLFAGRIEPGKPTRILYHHQNMMGKRVHLIVEVINSNPTTAKYHVLKGISKPNIDTVLVGHVAGSAFLRNCDSNIGFFQRVPEQSRYVLVSDMLDNKETASGILQINQTEGSDSFIRVTAAQPGIDNVMVGSLAAAPNPIILTMSDEVYPSPLKVLQEQYVVGERWAFISIGKHALTDSTAQKKLYGNYGVTYDIHVKVTNPTDQTKKISVLFDPTAGLASGVFRIDGRYVSAKYAQPPNEIPLTSYRLGPGQTKNLSIVTIPLAGSNYPATVIVKS